MHNILCDFDLKMDHPKQIKRSDIILVNKKIRTSS